MIEKIGAKGYETISRASGEVLTMLERIKREQEGNVCVAEIGIGIGATSVEIFKKLDAKDKFYLFSYESHVEELIRDLTELNSKNIELIGKGNSTKIYDSYSWTLAKMVLNMIEEGGNGIFDLVYLDGAHAFFHDSTACCLLKKLINIDGYIVFDDMYWSIAKSPTQNPTKKPEMLDKFTLEQVETCHVEMVVKLFMEPDKQFQQVFLSDNKKPSRSIWQRMY